MKQGMSLRSQCSVIRDHVFVTPEQEQSHAGVPADQRSCRYSEPRRSGGGLPSGWRDVAGLYSEGE